MSRREQWRHAFGQWRRANKSLSDHGAIARSMYWCGILRAISSKWDLPYPSSRRMVVYWQKASPGFEVVGPWLNFKRYIAKEKAVCS